MKTKEFEDETAIWRIIRTPQAAPNHKRGHPRTENNQPEQKARGR
jgi:hypothetical protein